MRKTGQQLLQDIVERLDRLTGFLAAQGKPKDEQLAILRKMGFEWSFIGSVVGLKADAPRMRTGAGKSR